MNQMPDNSLVDVMSHLGVTVLTVVAVVMQRAVDFSCGILDSLGEMLVQSSWLLVYMVPRHRKEKTEHAMPVRYVMG